MDRFTQVEPVIKAADQMSTVADKHKKAEAKAAKARNKDPKYYIKKNMRGVFAIDKQRRALEDATIVHRRIQSAK